MPTTALSRRAARSLRFFRTRAITVARLEAERLSAAIARSTKLCSHPAEKDKERESILHAAGETSQTLHKIVCRKGGRALLVPSEQILWFQVQDGIVHATTAKGSFWVNYQLSDLEAALPSEEFFRARREVLVNMSHIREIKPFFKSSFLLVMSDTASTEIAVSERQARPLRQRLPGL